MKILYYDCFAGISGDMNLAAMIDLGVDREHLHAELRKLGLDDEFTLEIHPDARKGIHGTQVDVRLNDHHRKHGHHHRNLKDIEEIIHSSGLDETVKTTSLNIFNHVARAEAKVHGKDLYQVHFHEVGDTDSIVDIVGAAICFHALEIDTVWCSAIELGGGFVQCAHGKIPVPAPATVEILHNCPTTRGAVQAETTTPTGAAILAELVDSFPSRPAMSITHTAYGIGQRDTDIPNVLRVHLATRSNDHGQECSSARVLQCNLDDMTPEMLGAVLDLLMANGAMDVHFTPITMKKNRPAITLSVLCATEEEQRFKQLIFRHTTTLGIKSFPIDKTVLPVTFEQLETPLGPVTMKHAWMDGKILRSKPELEDCRKLAERHGISLADVYLQIGKHRKI